MGSTTSQNFPKLLEQTLGETWKEGDPAWFSGLVAENREEQKPGELQPLKEPAFQTVHRLVSRRPSDAKPVARLAELFGPDRSGAERVRAK